MTSNGSNGEGGFRPPPNTYSGDRGGPAEDEALLAELRAISMKSSRSRFAECAANDDEDDSGNSNDIVDNGSVALRCDGNGDAALGPPAVAEEDLRIADHKRENEMGDGKSASFEMGKTSILPVESARYDGVGAVDDIAGASSVEATNDSTVEGGGGFHSTLPNTFTGDRGGDALDDDLFAELKAISIRSSSGNRFDNDGKDYDGPPADNLGIEGRTTERIVPLPPLGSGESNDNTDMKSRPLLPWKKRGAKEKSDANDDMEIVIAAPPAPVANATHMAIFLKEEVESKEFATQYSSKAGILKSDEQTEKSTIIEEAISAAMLVKKQGIQSNLPKTFVGDRGGSAEDADLLAELRAISNKSSSSNRFDGDNDDSRTSFTCDDSDTLVTTKSKTTNHGKEKQTRPLPPWKQMSAKKKAMMNDDMNIASVTVPLDPFENVMLDESENDVAANIGHTHALMEKSTSLDCKKKNDVENVDASKSVPPWKRKGAKMKCVANDNVDIVIAAPPAPSKANDEVDDDEAFFPNITSADLVNHCKDDDEVNTASLIINTGNANKSSTSAAEKPWKKPSDPENKNMRPLPPWKQKTAAKNSEVNIVITTPPAACDVSDPKNVAFALENVPPAAVSVNLPSTFKGDRGGSAEDEELLAELRAISMKSSNRFAGDGDENKVNIPTGNDTMKSMNGENDDSVVLSSIKSTEVSLAEKSSMPLPPWKRKGAKKTTVGNNLDVVSIGPPAPAEDRDGISNKQSHTMTMAENSNDGGIFQRPPANTFTGDRGGNAEDEELLAELRAISMKSAKNRFAGDENDVSAIQSRVEGQDIDPKPASKPSGSPSSVPALPMMLHGTLASSQGDRLGPPISNNEDEITITLEGLDESLKSSNWQMRKASYVFLNERMRSLLIGSDPMNLLNSRGVYPLLDQAITHALKDKNAGALDAALTLSFTYADTCQGACADDAASQIMISLLKGPAFSSTRSSTLSSTEELVLKLIEIAPDGSSSIQDIIDLIQVHGLKSVKPKVVIFSAKLILKAVQTFGASVLPITALKASSESLVAHSNAQAREIGMQLLAEVCRALGSKGPLQSLVDKLKNAQQSQLDSLLEMSATVPSRSLRRNKGKPVSIDSPEEALAALKKSQEEDEARRLASRPAINLFQVLPQTCYNEKIKLGKWSEKVAALDALIGAGGEQPFKLCQSVDYTQLIKELKQLLSHTHFAVCSKALAAFGMLAEGVGEQLLSNMRPLISVFLALFKDKKVINAVASCLDKMFANVFSFEHLLDSKDSLPSSIDEKKQKNALVRKNCLEYLTRCIQSSGTYGTRGGITAQYANDISKLACESLTDSDADTRKAGADVLLALLNSKDEIIVSATKNITSSLQTTNPRALKSLMLATNLGDAPSRPRSAPNELSTKAASQKNSSERSNKVTKSADNNIGPPRPISGPCVSADNADENLLPSFEDSVENLSALDIPKWGDDIDNEGILAGIQYSSNSQRNSEIHTIVASNWKARVAALNQLADFYRNADGEKALLHILSLFVVVRDCTKFFKDLSNFNVAKAMLELFTVVFGIYSASARAPDGVLYIAASILAVEKIGDKKLYGAASSCLHSICIVKDPQRVLAITVKTIGDVKSPLAHEAFLGWFKKFCLDFGAASLSKGVQDSLLWILKECESNNLKVREAALDVIGEMHSQLGPVLQAFIKSKDIQSSTMSLIEKVISDYPHDTKAQPTKRMLRCITLTVSKNAATQPNSSSILSIPTTDLVSSLKSDYLSRLNSTEGKVAWKIRRDALEEIKVNVDKCGGLIATDGSSFPPLKQLFSALGSRLNDSQSNLKPVAATLIGTILSHVDDDSQAKLGRSIFVALLSAAMNDMKKTMREAALSALSKGTERPKQNGGGTNLVAIESLIICLESALSDAALKSSGLPDVLTFLSDKLDLLYSEKTESNSILVHTQLAKVIVNCLLSSKSETRSATDKLLSTCIKSGIVPMEDIDNEIRKLLPAQQRTVRSIIPKISQQDQELVDSFRQASSRASKPIRPMSSSQPPVRQMIEKSNQPIRPSSSSQQPIRRIIAKSNQVPDEANPLHCSTAKSTKEQRLSILSRGDHWPEYPEEPSGTATLQTVCKSWSQLISTSSIQVLFPNGGIRSHEDAVGGCELLSRSIEYSDSILLQLDLIFKWTACALFSRDHTSGLRSLLSMLQLLLRRLRELSYVMQDAEATVLLPSLFEKAGVAKSQFRDQFLDVLSFMRSGELYPLQRYGSVICMTVIAKSKSSRARSLAASECSSCVKAVGTAAVGRKGVEALGKALSLEKVIDIRMSYLDLFECVVQKSSLERILELCVGDSITEKTKDMIIDRCSKRPSTAPVPNNSQPVHQNDLKQLRLRTPSRKTVTRTSCVSPWASNGSSDQPLSSSAVTETLKSRLQRLRDENHTGESLPCLAPKPSTEIEVLDIYTNTLNDIRAMINDNVISENGLQAIHRLCLTAKNTPVKSLNASQIDLFVEMLANVLKFAFVHAGGEAALPCPLIEKTVDALTYVFRTPEYSSGISQHSLECCLREAVHALLDDRLDASKGAKADGTGMIVKAINKLAMRAVASPPRETSLLALLSLQRSTVSSPNGNEARASRVYTKLFHRLMKDEHEKSPTNLLGDVELDLLLYSLDWLLQTVEEIRLVGESYELFKNAEDMSKDLMTELVKCRGDSVRNALSQLELPDGGLVDKLLVECEHKLGLRPPQFVSVNESGFNQGAIGNSESKKARFAELVNNFAEAEEGSDKQIALIALIDFKKENDIDLEASLSHLSPHFKEFILDQVGKASKENSIGDTMGSFNERMRNLRLKVGEDQVEPPVADKAASLRARLEALKHSSAGVAVGEVVVGKS
ncbi:hypothetical protein ACHAW5_010603 [Stephanodiscus triporus]|uniref:TOG domain-containing protein n=1 Tax=Stephanodiscus triporus TaxID=2934178 RepID=A0ABD3NF46_9STRA